MEHSYLKLTNSTYGFIGSMKDGSTSSGQPDNSNSLYISPATIHSPQILLSSNNLTNGISHSTANADQHRLSQSNTDHIFEITEKFSSINNINMNTKKTSNNKKNKKDLSNNSNFLILLEFNRITY